MDDYYVQVDETKSFRFFDISSQRCDNLLSVSVNEGDSSRSDWHSEYNVVEEVVNCTDAGHAAVFLYPLDRCGSLCSTIE